MWQSRSSDDVEFTCAGLSFLLRDAQSEIHLDVCELPRLSCWRLPQQTMNMFTKPVYPNYGDIVKPVGGIL